jgi:hypothetical protein
MTSRLNEHHYAFFLLALYSLISTYLFLGYQDSSHRFLVLALYAGYYFSWSIVYHLINRNLSKLIFLEYLLITFLALVTLKVVFFPSL